MFFRENYIVYLKNKIQHLKFKHCGGTWLGNTDVWTHTAITVNIYTCTLGLCPPGYKYLQHDVLRLQDTGHMHMWRCAHTCVTSWKCIVSSWQRTALRYTILLTRFRSSRVRFHSYLGNKVISITSSRDWRELFAISVMVSKILCFKHARLRFWR